MSVVTGAGCVGCSSAKVTREFSCIVGCNEITDGVSVTDCDVTPAALDRRRDSSVALLASHWPAATSRAPPSGYVDLRVDVANLIPLIHWLLIGRRLPGLHLRDTWISEWT